MPGQGEKMSGPRSVAGHDAATIVNAATISTFCRTGHSLNRSHGGPKCPLAKAAGKVRVARNRRADISWEHHMRNVALAAAMLVLVRAGPRRGHAGDRSARFARRGAAVDLQLSRQAGLRPCAGGRARAVSFADLQGAGERRHLSRLHRGRDRIEPGQGRATGQQLLSGAAGGRMGDRPRDRLFRPAGLAQSAAQGRNEDAGAAADDRRLSFRHACRRSSKSRWRRRSRG